MKSEKRDNLPDRLYVAACEGRVDRIFQILLGVGVCVLFACLCMGCAYQPKPMLYKQVALFGCTTPIQIVETSNTRINAAAWQAAALWNETLGWKAFTAEKAPTKVFLVQQRIDKRGALGQVKYYNERGCSNVMLLRIDPSCLTDDNRCKLPWVVAHELGHVLGLSHSPHRGDLMFRFTPRVCFGTLGRVTEEELDLIEALQQGTYQEEK